MNRDYTKAFKEQAIRLVTDKQYTPTRAARELGIPTGTLKIWLSKAGWEAPSAAEVAPQLPKPPISDDPAVLHIQIRELEARVKRLEMEKEILKKATAYFASQNL
jgi:transposase-like protein